MSYRHEVMAELLDANGLFARHLDLAPLRGRRHGNVRCRFHSDDRSPSLSVDLDRGLFHCFACGAQGGVRKFAELVGETPVPRPVRRTPETDLQRFRSEILRRARAEDARYREWLPWFICNDFIRQCAKAVREARTIATRLGPSDLRIWPLLEHAAQVEGQGRAAEVALDGILSSGRIS